MTETEILDWLREDNETRLEPLWAQADAVRRETVGDAVHLRGLVEISNCCCRACAYCGVRFANAAVSRYRMTADEILDCTRLAVSLGFGTVVMQSGEDYGIERGWLADIIRRIKGETGLAVTLSLGERPNEDLEAWREAGADRYLLRFETSDTELYRAIHPAGPGRTVSNRIAMLATLRDLGYETGSGIMVGIPGQTRASIARDIVLFRQLDLDMVGVGPYIPHPSTPLGSAGYDNLATDEDQAPNTDLMTYKVIALTRIVCPEANIPSTTALATVNRTDGHRLGLQRGANVIMPNLTPARYRAKYEIYPEKGSIDVTTAEGRRLLHERIAAAGRTIGTGPGSRRGALS